MAILEVAERPVDSLHVALVSLPSILPKIDVVFEILCIHLLKRF